MLLLYWHRNRYKNDCHVLITFHNHLWFSVANIENTFNHGFVFFDQSKKYINVYEMALLILRHPNSSWLSRFSIDFELYRNNHIRFVLWLYGFYQQNGWFYMAIWTPLSIIFPPRYRKILQFNEKWLDDEKIGPLF